MRDFNIKKLYYSISEVSKITLIEQYVLRYWENEFDELKPQKNRAGNRAYTTQDIKLVFVIKHLLRTKKYTLEGAKQILAEKGFAELQNEIAAENQTESLRAAVPATPVVKVAPIGPAVPKEIPPEQVILDRRTVVALKNVLKEILTIL